MSVASASAGDPYPLEYFALREVTSNIELSPDGDRVAMLKILSRDGNPVLHIYETANMSADPFVIDSDPMELIGYGWLSNTVIVIELRQKVRNKIEGQNQGVYDYKIAKLDLKREKFEEFDVPSPNVENIVRNKEDKIIISSQPGADENPGLPEAFRPRAYYMMDLRRGTRQLLIRGKISLAQIEFDADGDPWLARGFEAVEGEYVWYHRPKGGRGWDPIFRLDENSFEDFTVFGKDMAVPGNLLVRANNGHDIMGLWSYATSTKSFDELIYRRSDVDVYGVRFHSNQWQNPDLITAVSYYKDKLHYNYFDEIEGATYQQLEQLIPHAHYVAIQSRSRDGNTLTVFNQGPRDPGTYYLYNEGSFTMLGSEQPLIDSEELADLRYIKYKARDGRKIAALLTVPNGEGPFPLIVLPHGGPFVQEIVIYDEWAQMLANNGYLVVQPQFRGSHGYGLEHFYIAFGKGSEAGHRMQDDNDDAALYLVEEGLADPDRIAMFGWSYGGYAALVAASRTPQTYQCVIAGAAVADQIRQLNEYANDDFFRGGIKFQQETYRRGAVNPIDEVEKVNVPILLIHGSVDQRVQPYHARLYRNKLEKYGKDYKFVELDGADHFSNTLFYKHQIKLYESIIDFLKHDCGPGGL